jgi:hypothetical protein
MVPAHFIELGANCGANLASPPDGPLALHAPGGPPFHRPNVACHKMVTATKPFPQPNEAVLKTKRRQKRIVRAGVLFMAFVVAFLVCCSAAVFLAHAFDAYQAR